MIQWLVELFLSHWPVLIIIIGLNAAIALYHDVQDPSAIIVIIFLSCALAVPFFDMDVFLASYSHRIALTIIAGLSVLCWALGFYLEDESAKAGLLFVIGVAISLSSIGLDFFGRYVPIIVLVAGGCAVFWCIFEKYEPIWGAMLSIVFLSLAVVFLILDIEQIARYWPILLMVAAIIYLIIGIVSDSVNVATRWSTLLFWSSGFLLLCLMNCYPQACAIWFVVLGIAWPPLFKKYDVLVARIGVFLFPALGILFFFFPCGEILNFLKKEDVLLNLFSEAVGILITVLIIERLLVWRKAHESIPLQWPKLLQAERETGAILQVWSEWLTTILRQQESNLHTLVDLQVDLEFPDDKQFLNFMDSIDPSTVNFDTYKSLQHLDVLQKHSSLISNTADSLRDLYSLETRESIIKLSALIEDIRRMVKTKLIGYTKADYHQKYRKCIEASFALQHSMRMDYNYWQQYFQNIT